MIESTTLLLYVKLTVSLSDFRSIDWQKRQSCEVVLIVRCSATSISGLELPLTSTNDRSYSSPASVIVAEATSMG